MKAVSDSRENEVSKRLREDEYCREVLHDLISNFGYGQKVFNKPGYFAYVSDKLRHKPQGERQERIEDAFKFLEKHGLVTSAEKWVDVNKEKAQKYVPRNLRS